MGTVDEDIWFDLSADSVGPDSIVDPAGDWKLCGGREALRQSLVRALSSNPGDWKTNRRYGAGIRALLRSKATSGNRELMRTRARACCLADVRVGSVQEVSISRLTSPSGDFKSGWRLSVIVVPKEEPIPLAVEVIFDGV
jgi:phage baseplate assembly protein W